MGDASGLINALGQDNLDQRAVADHLVLLSKVGRKNRKILKCVILSAALFAYLGAIAIMRARSPLPFAQRTTAAVD